jgi:uncharacterized protein (TIGR01777 family)
MKILVSGSTGLIGSALIPVLAEQGHTIIRLVRRQPRPGTAEVQWNPEAAQIDAAALEGLDAVVHLAGENVAGRWTKEKKARILDSRVQGTRLLSETLARLKNPPRALASASAIGYYGNRGDEVLREDSAPGTSFMAEVCREWEEATKPASDASIRIVLSPQGGALAKMLTPFRLGVGGRIGSGNQYWSWIALDDVISAIRHVLATDELRGAVNIVAPQPVTNAEFTSTLGRALGRLTLLPVPAFAIRLAMGEMADEALLASARVEPACLQQTGYTFRHSDLDGALRHLLARST